MDKMTDARAVEVLAAHNEWRRGGDGPQTDPTTLGLAIDHAIARLREPAEAQARGGGEVVAWFPTNGAGEIVRNYGDGSPVYACKTKEQAEQVKRCHLGATGPVIPLYTAPPSAPVGVEDADIARVFKSLRIPDKIVAGVPIVPEDWFEFGRACAALAQQPAACPRCDGTGEADSGGIHPWGAPAMIRCECQQPAAVDALAGLDNIAGYFQDGSEETLLVTPDDATRTWHVYVGKQHLGYGKSIRAALTAALAAQPGGGA